MPNIIQLYSGGLDSLLLALVAEKYAKRKTDLYVCIDYGQENGEVDSACRNCPGPLEILNVPWLWGDKEGDRNYPVRNQLFLSLVVARWPAVRRIRMATFLDMRHPSFDRTGITDTGDDFYKAVNALFAAQKMGVKVGSPYSEYTLADMIELSGLEKAPFTRSCNCPEHHPGKKGDADLIVPCGECRKCRDIRAALALTGKDAWMDSWRGDLAYTRIEDSSNDEEDEEPPSPKRKK